MCASFHTLKIHKYKLELSKTTSHAYNYIQNTQNNHQIQMRHAQRSQYCITITLSTKNRQQHSANFLYTLETCYNSLQYNANLVMTRLQCWLTFRWELHPATVSTAGRDALLWVALYCVNEHSSYYCLAVTSVVSCPLTCCTTFVPAIVPLSRPCTRREIH